MQWHVPRLPGQVRPLLELVRETDAYAVVGEPCEETIIETTAAPQPCAVLIPRDQGDQCHCRGGDRDLGSPRRLRDATAPDHQRVSGPPEGHSPSAAMMR